MYVMSRVIFGLARTAVRHELVPALDWAFLALASLTWALVMWLFYVQKGTLQQSLAQSMQYLYQDSDSYPKNASNPIDWLMR